MLVVRSAGVGARYSLYMALSVAEEGGLFIRIGAAICAVCIVGLRISRH